MVEVIVVKGGRSQRFNPKEHGKVFLAKANIKPPAPIAENKQLRSEDAGNFGEIFEAATCDLPKRPRRQIYDTRLPHRRG